MTITLTPEMEAQLREKAGTTGEDVSRVAEALLRVALAWEAQERAEAIAGVKRGDQAAAEGRERPLSAILNEQEAKHGFASNWPQKEAGVFLDVKTAKQLHDKSTRGHALTLEEQALLMAWYAEQDGVESVLLRSTVMPSSTMLQQEIAAALTRLQLLSEEAQTLATDNEALRRENAELSQRLSQTVHAHAA